VSGGGATLVKTQETEYDGGVIGNSYVTKVKTFYNTGSTDHVGQRFQRTFRGHLRGVEPLDGSGTVVTPVTLYDVDW